MQTQCTIPDCGRPVWARRWCDMHYQRWRNHGSPLWQPALPFYKQFWALVQKTDDCWLWVGGHRRRCYGSLKVKGKTVFAHRVAYEELVGPIPKGLTLDHLCRNRPCVRPSHLEPVSLKVNILRGQGPAARNATKTHCIHGHEFTEANTYSYRGGRFCRQCIRRRSRESWRRRHWGTISKSQS